MTPTTRCWWPAASDRALAAALGAACLALTALAANPTDRPWWPEGFLLIAAAALALAWRRRAPLVVLALTVAAIAPYYWLGYPDGPAGFLVAVAIYTVASRLTWLRSVAVGAALLGAWVGWDLLVALRDGGPRADADHYGWIVVTVAVGVAVGGLRRAQTDAAERVEEQARRRVEQERLRLAREVHDVVSHSLAMISVQAGVAVHVADRRPEQAVTALLEIRDASRAALTELRATLDLLRDAESTDAPGLHRLDEITRVARLAGLGVDVRGSAGRLDASVDGAAFSIVREAVTNAVRHARRARQVTVELERDARELRLRVVDDGGPTGEVTPGNGLRGLAEHAVAVGGTSSATAGPGGFVVEAALPLTGTVAR